VTLSISYRTMPWLLGLIAASFVVQADDYMVLGIMEPLSADLDVGEAAVGQLVTVYSLVYAVGAPVLAVVISGRSKRVLLAAALLVFAVANFGVLVVDSYAELMALRVLAAGAAALILPAALAAAAQHSPPQARGRVMSLVMVGLTGAVVVGVPAGAYLAAAANWRVAFAMCGVIAIVAAAQLFFTLPEHGRDDRAAKPPWREVKLLADRTVMVLLVVTVIAVAGNLGFQTYLAPFVMGATGVDQSGFALLLVAVGLAGLVGTYASGALADRFSPLATLIGALAAFCASTAAMAVLWLIKPMAVAAVLPLLAVWSASAWAVPPAIQALLVARVGTVRAGQALAFNSSTVYIGAALGSAGGGLLVSVNIGAVPVAAALASALAVGVLFLAPNRTPRTGDQSPSA